MEYLQYYSFKSGDRKWSNTLSLQPGYEENWVADKTTDTGNKFVITTADRPDIELLDWVVIKHLEDGQAKNTPVTFNADGTPLNHTQYLVSAVSKTYDDLNGCWTTTLALMEPIERLKGVLGETLCYTSQLQKRYERENGTVTTYYKDAYNHYTALKRWLQVTPANCDTYSGTGGEPTADERKTNISWYNRLKLSADDIAFLTGIPFADTTYNELTLYNLLMDNYESAVNRIPVLYFDIDISTDLPYNEERDEYLLKFERKDGLDKPDWTWENLMDHITYCTESASMGNYATGLVANVTNLSPSERIQFPAESLFAVPEVNNDERNTAQYTSGGDLWGIRVPHKIKRLNKVVRLEYKGSRQAHDPIGEAPEYNEKYELGKTIADLSDNIKEKKEYLSDKTTPVDQHDTIWYEEGGNFIHIKDYAYNENDGGVSWVYYVEYEPLIDNRMIFGNTDFVYQLNQTHSQVDAEKFAAFNNSYLGGMNKADYIVHKTYSTYGRWADRLGKRVIRTLDNGEKEVYRVTNISYRNRGPFYDVIYQINKDDFRKNNSYQASQTIRKDIAISSSSIKERMTAIKQTIKIGFKPQKQEGYNFLTDKTIAMSALLPQNEYKIPQLALIEAQSVLRLPDGTIENFTIERLAYLAKYKAGNAICFSIRYYDNADAGKTKEIKILKKATGNPNTHIYYDFGDPETQMPVLYTDPFGEIQKVTIKLIESGNIDVTDMAYKQVDESIYIENLNAFNSLAALPELPKK